MGKLEAKFGLNLLDPLESNALDALEIDLM